MAVATSSNLLSAVGGFATGLLRNLYPRLSAMALKTQCRCFLYLRQSGDRSARWCYIGSMLSKVALVYFFENSTATIIAETPD